MGHGVYSLRCCVHCVDTDGRGLERGDVDRNSRVRRSVVARSRRLHLLRRPLHLRKLYPAFLQCDVLRSAVGALLLHIINCVYIG